MKFTTSLVLALPALVSAYPFMPVPEEDMLNHMQKIRDESRKEERALTDTISGAVGIVGGAVGSIASAVDPRNKRPEPGYYFQEPGPNDSRGPCPGLNLLANYGYLPRNGLVHFGEVLDAVSRGFNMGTDLATVLAVFATVTDGDIATESWLLGSDVTGTKGLPRHSTVEADISPNREDYYLGCGDNHDVSSRLVKQNVGFYKAHNNQFSVEAMADQYAANAAFSLKNNPYLYYFPFPSIVSVVAYNFYPAYFSNHTLSGINVGGDASYESISNIVGFRDNGDGTYKYVAERWPENWYRRATPYGAVEALTDGFTMIYPRNPIPMAIPQLGNLKNLNATTVACDIYQGIQSITPLGLTGGLATAAAANAWALSKLIPAFGGTFLGCPPSTVSNNPGAPYGPGMQVTKNAQNNVYNQTYFRNAPTTPQCNPSSN